MNIEYHHLSGAEKSKWKKIITSCLDSLPMEELRVVCQATIKISFDDN